MVEELAAVEKEYEGMLAEREEMKETNKLMDVEVCGVNKQLLSKLYPCGSNYSLVLRIVGMLFTALLTFFSIYQLTIDMSMVMVCSAKYCNSFSNMIRVSLDFPPKY